MDVNEDGRGGGVSGMYMKNYNISMMGFVYYCVFCIIIPITINELSQQKTLYSANIIFNFYLSPVLYNICFKWHFVYLYRNNRRMLFMYPFFILIGFGIRLLDMIPYLQTFVLSTVDFNYNSWGHKILFWSLVLYLNVIFVVEIMATVHWRLNMLLLFIGIGFMYLSLLSFVNLGVVYHIHHYFIGVMMHVICQRKRNIFSRLNNGIGLGVYLEGISKWGYANIVV